MIFEANNLFRFDKPGWVADISEEQRTFLVEAEESSKLQFIIPKEITNNKDRQVYKIGFLSEFLKRLYPDKNFNSICEIMSDRYDIFLSRRQIDRHVKKFLEDSN